MNERELLMLARAAERWVMYMSTDIYVDRDLVIEMMNAARKARREAWVFA